MFKTKTKTKLLCSKPRLSKYGLETSLKNFVATSRDTLKINFGTFKNSPWHGTHCFTWPASLGIATHTVTSSFLIGTPNCVNHWSCQCEVCLSLYVTRGTCMAGISPGTVILLHDDVLTCDGNYDFRFYQVERIDCGHQTTNGLLGLCHWDMIMQAIAVQPGGTVSMNVRSSMWSVR